MKVCSVDGCERKHAAKGLCRQHYKNQWKRDNPRPSSHRKVELLCTYCGQTVEKLAGKRKGYRPYCDYTCRDLDRWGRARCIIPADHPVMLLIQSQRKVERPDKPRTSKARFIAALCPCGTGFIADRQAFHSSAKYCSAVCSRRYTRKDRRLRERGINAHWTQIAVRDGLNCHICGDPCDPDDYKREGTTFLAGITYPSIDHVVALVNGGAHDFSNMRLAHMLCNSIKCDAA